MRQAKLWTRASVCIAAAILIVSCGRDASGPTAPRGRPGPAQVISDGAHTGNTHFYFLPPMVRQPAYTGTTDPAAMPVVSVCEWEASAEGGRCIRTIAEFTRTTGTGSEVVRYDAAAESYIVNWHTDTCAWGACALSPASRYRIRVLVGVSELGHADVVLGANAAQLKNVATDEYVALVNGRTLPVRFRIEQGAVSLVAAGESAPVGPSGGLVGSADGSVGLAIPEGALSASTPIAIAPSDSTPEGLQSISPLMELGPDGTTFAEPVLLTLRYDPAAMPEESLESDLAVVTLTDEGWEAVPGSVVDPVNHTVSAPIEHFSSYYVALTPNNVLMESQPTTLTIGQRTTLRVHAEYRSCTFCRTRPSVNWHVTWGISATTGVTVEFAAIGFKTDAQGNAFSDFVGVRPGSSNVRAAVQRPDGYWVQSPMVLLTVVPSLTVRVDSADIGMTPRPVGLQQQVPVDVVLATPAAAGGSTLALSHSAPDVAVVDGSAFVPAGQTTVRLFVRGVGTGRDTIIVNAPGHGPDSLVVDAGPGTIAVAGLPGTLDIGDSAAVRIVAKDPTGTHAARALNAAFTLGGGANLRFSDGSSAITSIAIADGDSITAPFYVVATAGGSGDVLITSPDYVDFADSIIVAGQPLVLRPDAGIVVAGWVFRQDITVATPMGTDVVVSATSLNHLTLGEAGTSNYTYPGQTRQYTLPAGSTVKTLTAVDLDGPGNTDTLVVSAPGMLPDTAIYTVVPGHLRVDGWPATLAYGDSAALTVTVVDDAGRPGALGYGIDLALGGTGLTFSDGQAPITTVRVQQRTSNTFYVKGAAGGTGTMTLSHPHYVQYSGTVGVESPPTIAASPTTLTITVAQGSAAQATIDVTNGGGGTLSGLSAGAFSDYFTGAAYPWISASLSSTTAPATITITAAPPADQFAQTYQTRFGVTAPGAVPGEFVFYRILVNVVPAMPSAEAVAGGNSSCMREESGSVFCWGESSYDATDAPADLFTTIDGSGFTYCGIRTDQTLRCWGYNSDMRATPPAGTFRQLNVAGESSCALRTDDTAACWGFSNDGRISVPPGTYSNIGVGNYHGCAVRKADATLVCWGRNDQGQATAPSGTFREVVGGAFHTCAIRSDLTLACFGASPAPPSGSFLSVSAGGGGGHTCAIRLDRTLACWGQNDFGQATPPAGQFAQVSAGRLHSCGVRTDGTPVCWGWNGSGAVTITRWSSAPAMPTPRWGAVSVTVGSQVYVIGGNASPQAPYPGGPVTTTMERYDAVARTWTTLAPLPSPVEHTMAAEYEGRIYVFGGWSCNLCGRNETWIYNIAGNAWTQGPNTPFYVNGGVAAVIGSRIYITTGTCCGSPSTGFVSFDPQSQTFDVLPNMPRSHPFTAGAGVIDGRLYVAGGEGAGGAVDMYDPGTNRWTSVASMPVNRQHGAGVVAGGRLYILGGSNDGSGNNLDVLVYDPGANAWSVATQAPVSRDLPSAALVNGSFLLMGGAGAVSPYAPVARVDVWRP